MVQAGIGNVERVLALAAYLHRQPRAWRTRDQITVDVPGYPQVQRDEYDRVPRGTADYERIRKALQRDLIDLRDRFRIEVDFDEVEGYRLRSPFFTPQERRALITAAALVDVDVDGEGAGEPETDDIGGAVQPGDQRIVVSVQHVAFALLDAIRSRTPARFTYHGRERVLHPFALGLWHARWYVTGAEQGPGERRQFRLDRFESQVTLDGPAGAYEIPDDFDAAEALRLDPNDWGRDPHVVARVRVAADHVPGFCHDFGGARVVGQEGEDAIVEVDVRHYDAFRTRVLAFHTHARVLAPPHLVAHVRDHLAALADGT